MLFLPVVTPHFCLEKLLPPLVASGGVVATCSRKQGKKLTQKNNASSGVQFVTPAGPRQSLLLAKDPDQFL